MSAEIHEASAPRTAPTLVTNHEVIGIGMKRLANELVGDVRAIEIAGVDMVDPARDRLAKYGEGRVAVVRRAEYARSGELHGAVAHTVHGAVAQ